MFERLCFLTPSTDIYSQALPFFESMGLRLPERKGIADFLQEVTSPKDQHKYRAAGTADHYIDVPTFAAAFARTAAARQTADRLAMPFDKAASLPGTLVSCC
jgi:hypothetical protein